MVTFQPDRPEGWDGGSWPRVIVGESPGREEERAGRPFVGRAGKLLDACLAEIGCPRQEWWITNTFRERPAANRIDMFFGPEPMPGIPPFRGRWPVEERRGDLVLLKTELEMLSPMVVVALGAVATWAMTGDSTISALRGTTVWVSTGGAAFRVFPTWHPAYVLRRPEAQRDLVEDLARAAEASMAVERRTG